MRLFCALRKLTQVLLKTPVIGSPYKFDVNREGRTGGTPQTITWQAADTNLAPVHAANVNIRLSIDGGQTFPIVLKANTPNDGTESVDVPKLGTTSARITVEAVGNIFLDISDAGFTSLGPTFGSVGGRVTGASGRGITGATVTMTTREGTVRTATTSRNGAYTFDGVPYGQLYEIRASHSRFGFTPERIVYNHFEQNSNQMFTGSTR